MARFRFFVLSLFVFIATGVQALRAADTLTALSHACVKNPKRVFSLVTRNLAEGRYVSWSDLLRATLHTAHKRDSKFSKEEIAEHLEIEMAELDQILAGRPVNNKMGLQILEVFIIATGFGAIASDPEYAALRAAVQDEFPDTEFMTPQELLVITDRVKYIHIRLGEVFPKRTRANFVPEYPDRGARLMATTEEAIKRYRAELLSNSSQYSDDHQFTKFLTVIFQNLNSSKNLPPQWIVGALVSGKRFIKLRHWVVSNSNSWFDGLEAQSNEARISWLLEKFRKAAEEINSLPPAENIVPPPKETKILKADQLKAATAEKMNLQRIQMRELIAVFGLETVVKKLNEVGGEESRGRNHPFWKSTDELIAALLTGEYGFGDKKNDKGISASMALEKIYSSSNISADSFLAEDSEDMIRISRILKTLKDAGRSRSELASQFGIDSHTVSELISQNGKTKYLLKSKAQEILKSN